MKKLTTLFMTLVFAVNLYGQIDEQKLKQLNDSINSIEKKFQDKELQYQSEIQTLNEQIISAGQLTKRIEALEKKQELLDKISTNEFIKDIELTQIRYEGGMLVLHHMMILMDALESQYKTIDFQQSYNDISNPNQYPEYSQNINFLKEKIVKRDLTLPDINLGNPVLNVAFSITRSIVSNQPNKDEKINELICILDFSSQASQNLIPVKYDLKYLQFTLEKMITNYEEIFKNYASIVKYEGSFRNYLDDPNENIGDLTKTFFGQLKQKEKTFQEKELKSLRFQLKKIIDAHLEFEIYIRQGLAYYEKFELIMNELDPRCGSQQLQNRLKSSHESVKGKLTSAKESFEKAYKDKIKQSYIKQLNEG